MTSHWSDTNLAAAFGSVRTRSKAAGIDGISPDRYAQDLPRRLSRLSQSLELGDWAPQRLLRLQTAKLSGGTRLISIPTVEDRIVIEVLRRELEPKLEKLFSEAAYAYRPRRSARDAVRQIEAKIQRGASWVTLGDIERFFDRIPVHRVINTVRELGIDTSLVEVLSTLLHRHATDPKRKPPVGIPQGSSLSPVLSNLVLTPLDRHLTAVGFSLIRYSDNLCILTGSESDAQRADSAMRSELQKLGLELKAASRKILPISAGFAWLGFWIGPKGAGVSEGAVRALSSRAELALRRSSENPESVLLPIVRGWVQYFDGPLPENVDLGAHGALLRKLVKACQPEPAQTTMAIEPWENHADFDDADDSDIEASPEAAALLLQADEAATRSNYTTAEHLYERARELERRADDRTDPFSSSATPELHIRDADVDAFIRLFLPATLSFERARRSPKGRRDFREIARPPTTADVLEHVRGQSALAVRPRYSDGHAFFGVIDLDASEAAAEGAVEAFAAGLTAIARQRGFVVLVEQTGGRGMHLWFPIESAASADQIATWLDTLLSTVGTPGVGVTVERLPARDDERDLYQQTITLPCGVHLETGERSTLILAETHTLPTNLQGLCHVSGSMLDIVPDPPTTLAAPSTRRDRSWTSFGKAVESVMAGCILLRGLAERAEQSGHLSHSERLSVLYTLGHLGVPGQQAIHDLIRPCANYDATETERQIDRMSGLPIGCSRMREKHVTPATASACNCTFPQSNRRGSYPTPLLHAGGFRHEWTKILRSRKAREAAPIERPKKTAGKQPPIHIVEEPTMPSPKPEPIEGLGCLPPHTWA